MAENEILITKIRTNDGDARIDYNALAHLPDLSKKQDAATAITQSNILTYLQDKTVANAGVAETADKLSEAVSISLIGDVIGLVNFDGSKNVSMHTEVAELDTINQEIVDLNSAVNKKAETSSYKATLSASKWSDSAPYTQSVTVSGILATDEPFVYANLDGVADGAATLESWMVIGRMVASANDTITAYCYEEKPEVDVPIILKVVR